MNGLRPRAMISVVALAAACGGSSTPPAEEEIALPTRDAGLDETDVPVCGDTSGDPRNCGACGNVCPGGEHGTAACALGKCTLACETGFGDCNANGADGCETDLTKEVASCGACGRDCRACGGTACTSSTCDTKTVVAPVDPGVSYVTLDATRVYFVNSKNVAQVEKGGANLANVYTVPNNTGGIAIDTLVNLVIPGTTAGAGIYRTSAGFVGPIAPYQAAGRNVLSLASDSTGVYYAAEKTQSVSELVRCNNCGGNPSVLSASESAVGVQGIALDETTVFFGAGDTIRRIEKTAADAKTLVVGQAPRSLAVDATHVYWINQPPTSLGDAGAPKGEIVRIAKSGGTAAVLATGLRAPLFLAATASGVYFTDRGSAGANEGVLVRLTNDGKSRLVLAKGLAAAAGVAVDDSCVYFGDANAVKQVTR